MLAKSNEQAWFRAGDARMRRSSRCWSLWEVGRSGVQSAEQRAFSHAAVWQGLGNSKLAGKLQV
jgi:1,2-phenylacetyl-CoA epoxidase PaaB subunit